MILVDSSVWVDYFNGRASHETDFLDSLLGTEPVAVGDLILAEVLQGFRSDADYETAKELLANLTAYELLGGQKPFEGETPDEILRKELDRSQDFIAPRQLNPEIPFALEKAILKCLEREPDNRYPITSVLVHDLKTALYV